jgi:hypothetical protein
MGFRDTGDAVLLVGHHATSREAANTWRAAHLKWTPTATRPRAELNVQIHPGRDSCRSGEVGARLQRWRLAVALASAALRAMSGAHIELPDTVSHRTNTRLDSVLFGERKAASWSRRSRSTCRACRNWRRRPVYRFRIWGWSVGERLRLADNRAGLLRPIVDARSPNWNGLSRRHRPFDVVAMRMLLWRAIHSRAKSPGC